MTLADRLKEMESLIERFWSRVERPPFGCWTLKGRASSGGYVLVSARGAKMLGHRLSYLLAHGAIPEGLSICHRCNNKACVNPDHLYAATNRQNTIDAGRDGLLVRRIRERCPKGHVIEGKNLYRYGPQRKYRSCKQCRLAATRAWKKRKKDGNCRTS